MVGGECDSSGEEELRAKKKRHQEIREWIARSQSNLEMLMKQKQPTSRSFTVRWLLTRHAGFSSPRSVTTSRCSVLYAVGIGCCLLSFSANSIPYPF